MYVVSGKDIKREQDPRELIWKCFAWMDLTPRDRASISMFYHKATGNEFISDEQITATIELLTKDGLLKRPGEGWLGIAKPLHAIAEYIDKNPLPNSIRN